MKLEMYGHYYRMFKGTGGVPTKVTVVGIEGDTVTLVRGHYTKEDFEERSEDLDEAIRLFCLTKVLGTTLLYYSYKITPIYTM